MKKRADARAEGEQRQEPPDTVIEDDQDPPPASGHGRPAFERSLWLDLAPAEPVAETRRSRKVAAAQARPGRSDPALPTAPGRAARSTVSPASPPAKPNCAPPPDRPWLAPSAPRPGPPRSSANDSQLDRLEPTPLGPGARRPWPWPALIGVAAAIAVAVGAAAAGWFFEGRDPKARTAAAIGPAAPATTTLTTPSTAPATAAATATSPAPTPASVVATTTATRTAPATAAAPTGPTTRIASAALPPTQAITASPAMPATPGVAGPAAARAADAPPIVIVADDPAAAARLLQLTRGGTGEAPPAEAIVTQGWRSSLAALAAPGPARVALLRYDALRAARAAPSSRSPGLEVVAPVAAERIHFVVRADSPLVAVHDIEGRVVDAGPAAGGRALTASTLYRAMFGAPMRSPRGGSAAADPLQRLRDRSAEVAVVVGPWPPATGGDGFRPLRLDPKEAHAARAVRTFLPLPPLAGDRTSVPTFGQVSFLVTARPAAADRRGHDRAVAALATSLCGRPAAPGTPAAGPAADRIDPKLRLDVGLPYAVAAQEALARCPTGSGGGVAAVATRPTS